MTESFRNRQIVVGMLVVLGGFPGALGAQPVDCKINDSSPYQVNGAKQYVTMAASSRKDDEIPKHLSNAIRVLTDNADKIGNESGRQYLLMRTYAQWLKREGATFVMKRGSLGFSTAREADQNLLLALDSAVVAIERLQPECKALVRPFRDEFLNQLYNKSVAAMNADQNDSSVYYAKLSLQLASTDPRPWNVLSAVYQKQNLMDSAMKAMENVIRLSGSDTTYKKIRQQSRYNLAVIKLQLAEQPKPESKDSDIKLARTLLEAYLQESPGEASATQAQLRAMRLAGDTASAASVFADMLKSADKFSADQLFEAASNAASSGREPEAVTLFESGLKKNAYHRLALLNLSNVLFQLKNIQRMGEVTAQLAQIEPNNPETWTRRAGYWQIRRAAETDAAKKKAYGDSTIAAITARDAVNPKITIHVASRSGNAYQVQGNLSNEGDKAGSYTLKFELLDEAGGVVTSKDVAVGPVDAGSSSGFSLKVEGAKIVAYRYAPVK